MTTTISTSRIIQGSIAPAPPKGPPAIQYLNYKHGWSIGDYHLNGVFGEDCHKFVRMGSHNLAIDENGQLSIQRDGFIEIRVNGFVIGDNNWIPLKHGDILLVGSPTSRGILMMSTVEILQEEPQPQEVKYSDKSKMDLNIHTSIRCMVCFDVSSTKTCKMTCCSQLICETCVCAIEALNNKCPVCGVPIVTEPLDVVSQRIISVIESTYMTA